MELLIKGGIVINPKTKTNEKLDVLIRDDIVVGIEKNIDIKNRKVIDAEGMIIAPGFIDIHVHLREPGFEYKETIETGTKSAAAGGFTTVACMPNTNPAIHSKEIVEFIQEKAEKAGKANVLVIGSITKDLKGEELSDIDEMYKSGIVAISDDGKTPMKEEIMIEAFKKAKKLNIPLISHCEDHNLSKGGSINAGKASERTKIEGIPSAAEYLIVKRDIELCDMIDSKLHIAHVSTKESVQLLRRAKSKGINVTAEVAPHHFVLTDDIITSGNTYTKVNPPIRSKEDVDEIIKGILEGTIDIIATDHAPHDESSKNTSYDKASFGITGLETAFSLSYTYLVKKNKLPLIKLIEMMTIKPAEIIGIDKGSLEVGKKADIVIVDLNKEYIIDSDKFYSKGKNTPFNGYKVMGKPIYTIMNGKIVYKEDKIICS
ncbi:dihydroorotase [Paramaledivibacter caminithermalis]|jgi:dihydroorotase|uniref:Dihydroorotase n=1 Tax=Paramaledivibacter caminithermalis (strain DSM 15212 / CIP 107654 / DViRD3) TaxID=1121301 RepID=A0A1M6TNI1_PARC5|nr:dihydroorotase [Paramaledivibacter caminithermalis]SHK58511.1 dihydroorotase [Paramaledivibacter caminithermalis DSM 15212]